MAMAAPHAEVELRDGQVGHVERVRREAPDLEVVVLGETGLVGFEPDLVDEFARGLAQAGVPARDGAFLDGLEVLDAVPDARVRHLVRFIVEVSARLQWPEVAGIPGPFAGVGEVVPRENEIVDFVAEFRRELFEEW